MGDTYVSKSIEVHGFKPLLIKCFEFDTGITAIAGPNGSGKVIADAVRWVLVSKVKQLRGSKMEDVIFSGMEMRKPSVCICYTDSG